MYGYIYLTTNHVNGKRYIGRKTATKWVPTYLGSGTYLLKALAKYGKDNFTNIILQECNSLFDLVHFEMYYIKKFNAVKSDMFYNTSNGGFFEDFLPGAENIMHICLEARRKNSEAHRGKRMSDDFREKQRLLHIGKPSGMKGKHHSNETKQVLSERSKSRKHTKEECQKMSDHHKASKFLTNGLEQHWFYGDDIEKMLSEGWYEGICKPRKPKTITDKQVKANEAHGKRMKNTVWVHKGCKKLQIQRIMLDEYIQNGYSLGMKD